ncbi:MAG: hemerythrin family protein [Candidatus Kuenenia sp.]|nr:hemerythrin family protein [Candidatus Kuenenia hertensis]
MNNTLYIVWNQNNELGISIIDEQHRGIVATINAFYYFINRGNGLNALRPTLNMLSQYTSIHFRTEETLMKETGYKGIEEHILLHEKLKQNTIEIAREATTYKEPEIALKFLKSWWLGHINGKDKLYAPHLKKTLGIQ